MNYTCLNCINWFIFLLLINNADGEQFHYWQFIVGCWSAARAG